MGTNKGIKISKSKLATLFKDNIKSAKAINLVYVTDSDPGITRVDKNGKFTYLYAQKPVKDESTLARIKSLVLPPAWKKVWLCPKDNGHLQATGLDTRGRKQYKYHPLWNAIRTQAKFNHLYEFGKALPAIRNQIATDMKKQGLPVEKVLAAVVDIMQNTCIRIGNTQYEKLYHSYGLTTLKDKHVTFKADTLRFTFTGKKGVAQDITLKNKKLANIVKRCQEIPGKELFQYYDHNGQRHPVDSGMLNNYIRQVSGGQFTAKDFRTWEGTLHAINAFIKLGCCDTISGTKKNIVAVLDIVAEKLGNTRAVCKKYYVHPLIIDHYTNNTISLYLDNSHPLKCNEAMELTEQEQVLMKMLEHEGASVIAA